MRFSPFRRRRVGSAGRADTDAADPEWHVVDERAETVVLPSAHELRVRVRDVGGLRAMSVAGGSAACTRLVVQVAVWRRPYPGWTGRMGPAPGVRRLEVDWPQEDRGPVTLSVELWEPTDVGTLAVALLPLLVPFRPAHPGFVSASVSSSSSSRAALLSCRAVEPAASCASPYRRSSPAPTCCSRTRRTQTRTHC